MRWHPDNLKEGRRYKFKYRTDKNKTCDWEGIYLRMEADKEFKVLWLWFLVEGTGIVSTYRAPMDATAIISIEEDK